MRGQVVEGTGRVGALAKWLLIAFATGVLTFLLWGADAPDVIVMDFVVLPWIAGPAALAALLVVRAWSKVEAWLFFGAEAAVVASTVGLWSMLFIDPEPRNAQSVIAIFVLPIVQFALLLAYFLSVLAIARCLRRTRSAPV